MVDPALKHALGKIDRSPEILGNLTSSSFFLVDYANQSSSMSKIMRQAGLKYDDLTDNRFFEHLHPDDVPTYRSLWQRVWSGLENEMLVEYRLKQPAADYIWVQTQCLVISRQIDGSPSLMVGLDSDINARKLHESYLQDELAFYKTRLLQYEHLREAERTLNSDQEILQVDKLLLSARKVLKYDLLRVFRLVDGELELLGSDSSTNAPDGHENRIYSVASHDTSLARSTLVLPIPRIVELDSGNQVFKSWMGIPLLKVDQPFAILELFHHEANAYHSEHIWTAKAWGEHLANSILNSSRIQEIQTAAYKDQLSGLYNRRYIDNLIQRDSHFRNQPVLSLLMIDLDHFKEINDLYGHTAGDQVIQVVSRLMESVFRQADVLCRFGGDEFLVFLPGTAMTRARAVAERFRQLVKATSIPGIPVPITLSCGGSSQSDFCPENYEELFRTADQALYRAKQSGRNQVSWYEAPKPGK